MTDDQIGHAIISRWIALRAEVGGHEKLAAFARELLAPPAALLPPICGMTEKQIREEMTKDPIHVQAINLGGPLFTWALALGDAFARVAHRLAQPVAAVAKAMEGRDG